MFRLGVMVLAMTFVANTADPGSDVEPELRAVLVHDLKFSAADLTDLDRGKIVKHALGTNFPGEIAAVGAVRVTARKETLIARYRDITQFKRGPDIVQIGRFSDPPVMDDLAALTITRRDLDLRGCRVRDCDVRLPAETIGRIQREIDWKAGDADARAAALFKQIVYDDVRAYTSGGPGRILEYDDGNRPIHPLDDFAGLLKNSPYLDTLLPSLADHLQGFPAHALREAEDFLYWSKEKFGLTPFITVTHVTMAPATPGRYVIASRDVYSSRYFDASLALTIASDAVAGSGAFYLIYVNRWRANALKGAFAGFRRSIVERRAKDSLEQNLRDVKRRLEQGS